MTVIDPALRRKPFFDELIEDSLKSNTAMAGRMKDDAQCGAAFGRLQVVCQRLYAALHKRLVL